MSKSLWGVFRMFNGGNGIKMCENMKYIYIYNYLNNYIYIIYTFLGLSYLESIMISLVIIMLTTIFSRNNAVSKDVCC